MRLTARFLLLHASTLVFCLVVAAGNVGCSRGVRFTIEKARVSPSGTITFAYRETDTGPCKIITPGGESCSAGGFGSGGSGSSTMDTDDPSSVRFFVREGESFFMPPGTQKTLFTYSNRARGAGGKAVGPKNIASYWVRVDEWKEEERTFTGTPEEHERWLQEQRKKERQRAVDEAKAATAPPSQAGGR
jgi:hypothetical protein